MEKPDTAGFEPSSVEGAAPPEDWLAAVRHGPREQAAEQRAQAAEHRVEQLTRALASRPRIEQAKGVLMAVYGISDEDAFQALVTVSQNRNIKLVHVASHLVTRVQEVEFGTTIRDTVFEILSSTPRPDTTPDADTDAP